MGIQVNEMSSPCNAWHTLTELVPIQNCSRSSFQGLTKLLADYAPKCQKEEKFDSYFGRRIAVDASMHIYQFLVRVISHHFIKSALENFLICFCGFVKR